jgi:GNAT superfamily N-acetyltransferase
LTSRPASVADAKAIFELVAGCELADDGMVEVDEDDVRISFERQGFEPSRDTVLVFDADELVGWAQLYRKRAEGDVRKTHLDRGIGSELLRWIETRAREIGDDRIGQSKTDANAGARVLFLSSGYQPAWVSWILRTRLDRPVAVPEPPARISIRPYEEGDAPFVHRLIDDAFSEWPGRDPEPFQVWADTTLAHPGMSPELSPLAFDGEDLVGVVISIDLPQFDEGWIDQVATRATHRNRGIAQALLRTAFSGFRDRGRKVAGVSTDSRTGALGLYEKVGMTIVRQYTRYTKHLEKGAGDVIERSDR